MEATGWDGQERWKMRHHGGKRDDNGHNADADDNREERGESGGPGGKEEGPAGSAPTAC